MERLKSFITRYSKVYIGLVLLIWIAFFFLFEINTQWKSKSKLGN